MCLLFLADFKWNLICKTYFSKVSQYIFQRLSVYCSRVFDNEKIDQGSPRSIRMRLTTIFFPYTYMCVSTFRFWSRVGDFHVTWMKRVTSKCTKIRYFVVYYNQQEQYGESVNFWCETDVGVSYFRPTKKVSLVTGFRKIYMEHLIK
jgi:hypothetical protein